VEGIHLNGGTVLGTSRGGAAKISQVVDRLDLWRINMLFVIGGNGGNTAAHAIHAEAKKTGLKMAIIGIPKSIDNDILLVSRAYSSISPMASLPPHPPPMTFIYIYLATTPPITAATPTTTINSD
jgi:hypothetical protein